MRKGVLFYMSISIFLMFSCKKSEENKVGTAHLEVLLTDAPGEYTQVNVDVLEVRVHHADSGWMTMDTEAGIYNLLDFSGGLDTLIASDDIPVGYISQIRLVLGPNNSVMVDSVLYDMDVPSGETSGLKLNVQRNFEEGRHYYLTIDFDAAKSVKNHGNSGYKLHPVLRLIQTDKTACIHGQIDPAVVSAIYVVSDTDTVSSSFSNDSGKFSACGVEDGWYVVHIDAPDPYKDVQKADVNVTGAADVDLGVIVLEQ